VDGGHWSWGWRRGWGRRTSSGGSLGSIVTEWTPTYWFSRYLARRLIQRINGNRLGGYWTRGRSGKWFFGDRNRNTPRPAWGFAYSNFTERTIEATLTILDLLRGWYWSHRVHLLGPFLDSLWGRGVGRATLAFTFAVAVGLSLREESLVFRTEATDHVNQAAVLGIQLPHVLGISLIPLHADGMAPWDLMFMSLHVFGNLLW
jgi:hypothetical protein